MTIPPIPPIPPTAPEATRLFVHGIGSRGEGLCFPCPQPFRGDLVCCSYEPDQGATEQTSQFLARAGVAERLYPLALAAEAGEAVFNLNHDPYTSSLRPLNPAYQRFYVPYDVPNGDYVFGETMTPVQQPRVPTIGLGSLCRRDGLGADYLHVDTQGTEAEVFAGAGALFDTDVLAFTAELEYHPLYAGQTLIDDLIGFAVARGFHPIRFINERPGSFFRGPIGWRGTAVTFCTNGLFFKDPARLPEAHADPYRSLIKLAFIALCFENVEYCLDCLQAAEAVATEAAVAALAPRAYARFLARLQALFADTPKLYPPSFAQMMDVTESLARFRPGARDDVWDPAAVRARYFATVDKAEFRRHFPALLAAAPSPLEQLVADHDMAALAERLRTNRLAHARTAALALGLPVPEDAAGHAALAQALAAL